MGRNKRSSLKTRFSVPVRFFIYLKRRKEDGEGRGWRGEGMVVRESDETRCNQTTREGARRVQNARNWNRNKPPVISHLIFNLRRICRTALPCLLFFSLQWNC